MVRELSPDAKPPETLDPITVEPCDDGGIWESYVRSAPGATLYHCWVWRDLLAKAYRQAPRYLVARRGARPAGLLPMVEVRSPLFGSSLVSLPYHCIGGPLSDDAAAEAALLDRARADADASGNRRLLIRAPKRLDGDWQIDEEKATYVLDLSAGPDGVWKALRKQNRNRVRRGEKEGFRIRFGHDLLDTFYALYVRTMRQLGSPVSSREVYRRILHDFGREANVGVAFKEGRAVAAKLFIDGLGTRHVICGASDGRLAEGAPNYLLAWACMNDAMEKGLVRFDFGRSTRGSTHAETKRYWGCQETPLYYHYATQGRGAGAVKVTNPKYERAIRVWRRLPVWLTRRLGPPIARQIP